MYLGVDGGGTKTAFCLLDASGTMRAEALGPSTSPALGPDGLDTARQVLRSGVAKVCRQAGTDATALTHAYFGLPGHGESVTLTRSLDALPAQVLGHNRYGVGNDMVCGWAGSLGLADGINVISGTGSMAYGVIEGREARVGGWGELFGDEGSAHWIALRGLNLFTRRSDGRTAPGPLTEILRRHLALGSDLELIDAMLLARPDRTGVAALSRQVSEAARAGDAACARILTEAGEELAELARAARRMLVTGSDRPVSVSWSGGVLGVPQVREAFVSALASSPERYETLRPRHTPVIGAALLAARLAGEPLSAQVRGTLPVPPGEFDDTT